MARDGYLEAESMAHVFDLLRANDLVFQYVGKQLATGQASPPPSTYSSEQRQHANAREDALGVSALVLPEQRVRARTFVIGRLTLDPKAWSSTPYVVAAINDHITVVSGYKTAQMFPVSTGSYSRPRATSPSR